MDTTSDSGGRTQLIKFSANGVEVGLLAEMAGHAGIWTTQHCVDMNDEQMRRAAELIQSKSC